MQARDYELIASIVNGLPSDIKQDVADHFARSLVKLRKEFDPMAWQDRTGGRVTGRDFAAEAEAARKERVRRYLEAHHG